jgi:O-antigen ligase
MLNRLLALLAGIGTGLCSAGILLGPTPISLKCAAVATAVLAATRTADALLIVAALAPVGGALSYLSGSSRSWTLPLVLALLFGASIRGVVQRRAVRSDAAVWAGAIWIGLLLISLCAQLRTDVLRSASTGVFLREFTDWLLHSFPMTGLGEYRAMDAAVIAASGATLFVLTALVGRNDPQRISMVIRALVVSVAAVGVFSVNRLIEVAVRHPPFLRALFEYASTLRISTLFPDVNAAGALFLLTIPVACSLLWRSENRWLGAVTIPWLIAGLWLSGSKTALALLPVAVGVVAVIVRRGDRAAHVTQRPSQTSLVLVVVVVLAIAAFAVYTRLPRANASRATAIRMDFVATTMAMVRAHPWIGVGIGQYHRRSSEFMPESLRQVYRAENAHNQFLQVLGELGIVGLAAFAAVITVGLGPALRRIADRASDPPLAGLTTGVGSLLVVSLGMHPLLIPEVAMVFFFALGLTRGAALASIRVADSQPAPALSRAQPIGS